MVKDKYITVKYVFKLHYVIIKDINIPMTMILKVRAMTIETIKARSAERDIHEDGRVSVGEALLCPLCEQPVNPDKFEEIQGKERARAVTIERTLQARFAGEMAKAEAAKKAQIAAIRQEAVKTAKAALAPKFAEAEQRIKSLKADQQAAIDRRLKEQREALDKAKVEAVNAEKAVAHAERMRLDAKLQELTRQLQKKTANEIGDISEVDLYKILKSEFTADNIYRLKKGQKGADIVQIVIDNGKTVGKIIYDSKDRKQWQNAFTRKLRQDQLAENENGKADHAVLCSNVFPAGVANLHQQDGVLVVDPRRVLVLANILRRQIVQVSTLRLADHERRNKTERIYSFITSARCAELWDQLVRVNDDMAAVDLAERAAHDKVWGKRTALERSLRDVHDQFVSTIAAIIGATGSETSE